MDLEGAENPLTAKNVLSFMQFFFLKNWQNCMLEGRCNFLRGILDPSRKRKIRAAVITHGHWAMLVSSPEQSM